MVTIMVDLFSYQDLDYKEFNDRIIKTNTLKTIGIRTPILKQIAYDLSLNNYDDFLNTEHIYYEEILIHGFILGYLKRPFKDILEYLDAFIPLMDNWAVTDMVGANLKSFKKNQEEGYSYILKLLEGNNWSTRFGLVLLLDHYINDNYIDNILRICLDTKNSDYYISMANSWLISICYIKYPNKTIKLIQNKKLDKWVKNKAISKICDSYRVSAEDKNNLKKYRSLL